MIKQDILNNCPPRVKIIGVPISAVNMESCVEFLFSNWEAIHGQYICVSNAHTTVMAHDDPAYYKVQAESLLSVPDGKPLSLLGKKKYPQMDRVTGPDLLRRILEESKNREIRHFFYGTTQENLDALIAKIKADYPWVQIAGYEPSVFRPLTEQEESELVHRINSTKADFVWVALGAPRQEVFCHQMEGRINGLMVGVGGAFNVVSGVIPEAPLLMQRLSLEWLYRLMQEPKRLFKRYATTNSKFIYYVLAGK
jgi:N-acetylglucosaminyldiphosphoundecaprenol N-acetyl-beta-D-mannosaminyltransferase